MVSSDKDENDIVDIFWPAGLVLASARAFFLIVVKFIAFLWPVRQLNHSFLNIQSIRSNVKLPKSYEYI